MTDLSPPKNKTKQRKVMSDSEKIAKMISSDDVRNSTTDRGSWRVRPTPVLYHAHQKARENLRAFLNATCKPKRIKDRTVLHPTNKFSVKELSRIHARVDKAAVAINELKIVNSERWKNSKSYVAPKLLVVRGRVEESGYCKTTDDQEDREDRKKAWIMAKQDEDEQGLAHDKRLKHRRGDVRVDHFHGLNGSNGERTGTDGLIHKMSIFNHEFEAEIELSYDGSVDVFFEWCASAEIDATMYQINMRGLDRGRHFRSIQGGSILCVEYWDDLIRLSVLFGSYEVCIGEQFLPISNLALNGANGEATNSDDVVDIRAHRLDVPECDFHVALDIVLESVRSDFGGKFLGVCFYSGRIRFIFLGCGAKRMISQLSGSHGEWTMSDDVPIFILFLTIVSGTRIPQMPDGSTYEEAKRWCRSNARKFHPDKGASHEDSVKFNNYCEEKLDSLRGKKKSDTFQEPDPDDNEGEAGAPPPPPPPPPPPDDPFVKFWNFIFSSCGMPPTIGSTYLTMVWWRMCHFFQVFIFDLGSYTQFGFIREKRSTMTTWWNYMVFNWLISTLIGFPPYLVLAYIVFVTTGYYVRMSKILFLALVYYYSLVYYSKMYGVDAVVDFESRMKAKFGMRPVLYPKGRPVVAGPIFKGAGKGKSFISAKVKNKGAGRGSKAKKDVQAPVAGQADNLAVAEALDANGAEEEIEEPFLFSEDPNVRMLYATADVGVRNFMYDCQGSPFCGLTCIDLATRNKIKVSEYRGMLVGVDDPWDQVGTAEYMHGYALHRGVNLAVYTCDEHGNLVLRQKNLNSPAFKWVRLCYLNQHQRLESADAELVDMPAQENAPGHYVLICEPISDECPWITVPLIEMQSGFLDSIKIFAVLWSFSRAIYPLTLVMLWLSPMLGRLMILLSVLQGWLAFASLFVRLSLEVEIGEVHMQRNNLDRRSLTDRRENLRYQDAYVQARWITTIRSLGGAVIYGGANKLAFLSDVCWSRTLVVSCSLVNQMYVSMQKCAACGTDPLKSLSEIGRFREVNVDVSLPNIYTDTAEYCRWLSKTLKTSSITADLSGLVVENAGNGNVVIPVNRVNFNPRGGNKVERFKIVDLKERKPIAVAPIGCIVTPRGVLGPGSYCTTESASLLAAFVGRSMLTMPTIDNQEMRAFLEFGHKEIDYMLQTVELDDLVEGEPTTFFREHYAGLKPRNWIDEKLNNYERFVNKEMPSDEFAKFQEHSCFVKFEDSFKEGGENTVKPRLIMTMSDELLVSGCQILTVLHRFNQGVVSKYYVKELTPDEMIQRVLNSEDKNHVVTDYSSFEASMSEVIRRLENYAMSMLCLRAGFLDTLASIKKVFGGRKLTTKFGTFEIMTRCSGDFWTSFGNGLTNVLLSLYTASLTSTHYRNMTILAEGDDGVIPIEAFNNIVCNKLGFKLSQDQVGSSPGDTDFLKTLWYPEGKILNVGRMLGMLWVKQGHNLKRSKQLYILRCMGASLHYLSPGHPVLFSLVNLIGRSTRSTTRFKGVEKYLNMWRGVVPVDSYPRNVICNEALRPMLANSTVFPPIPIHEQIRLEDVFDGWDGQGWIGELLNDSPDVCNRLIKSSPSGYSRDFDEVVSKLVELDVLKDSRTVGVIEST